MGYNQILHIEIECDFPGCDEYLEFSNEEWEKIDKMIRSIGWTYISFPGEERHNKKCLYFCARCKGRNLNLIEEHVCILMRKTKKGEPSEYGSILECYFCEKTT